MQSAGTSSIFIADWVSILFIVALWYEVSNFCYQDC